MNVSLTTFNLNFYRNELKPASDQKQRKTFETNKLFWGKAAKKNIKKTIFYFVKAVKDMINSKRTKADQRCSFVVRNVPAVVAV